MQPHFLPYVGYFCLCTVADEFLVFDCVQFAPRPRAPNRGAAARGRHGVADATCRTHRDTAIREVAFTPEARSTFDERLRRHRWIERGGGPAAGQVRDYLHAPMRSFLEYVEQGLHLVAGLLGIEVELRPTSELGLPDDLRGQDRVIAASAAGATAYVNAPGGRGLYDTSVLERAGIELSFLSPYDGRYPYLLSALLNEDPADIRRDVLETAGTERP